MELSPKAWALYNFLKKRTLGNSTSVTQREIYEFLVENKFQVTWSEAQNMHNDHCRAIKDLVDEINFSTELDKLVYQKDWLYRIASEEEAAAIAAKYHDRAMKALERESVVARKCRRDGQGKLVNNAGNPMKPGNHEFHEAFNKPAPPDVERMFITYEERDGANVYSKAGYATVPYGLSDERVEEELAKQMREGCELKHWRRA